MSDAAIATAPQTRQQSGSFWPMLWRQFRAHKGGVAGLIVFIFILKDRNAETGDRKKLCRGRPIP